MKHTILVPREIEVPLIRLQLPVRYKEEDIPNDFPLRKGDWWDATVEVDTGRIINWPDNPRFQECSFYMKVVDEGTYTLMYADGSKIAVIEQDYVPNGIVPGEYGDYADIQIKNGVIINWPKNPDVSEFFPDNQDD